MQADPDAEQTNIRRAAPLRMGGIVHALVLREAGAAPRRIALRVEPLSIGRGPANALVLASSPAALFEGIRELTGRRPFEDDVSLLTFDFPGEAA